MNDDAIEMLVIDTPTNQPKIGDAANLLCYLSVDGGASTVLVDTSAFEVNSVTAPGIYRFSVSPAERVGARHLFTGKSTTAGVFVVPSIVRTECVPELMLSTTISSLTSQTIMVLAEGSSDNDVYNDQLVVITDAATVYQKSRALVVDYDGATKTLTLASAPGFTISAGDRISVIAVPGLTVGQNAQLSLIGAGTRMTVKEDLGTSISMKIGDTYSATAVAKRIDVNDPDSSRFDLMKRVDVALIAFGLGDANKKDVLLGTVSASTITHTPSAGSVSAYTTIWVESTVPQALKPTCGTYDIQITFVGGEKKTVFSGSCELVKDNKS